MQCMILCWTSYWDKKDNYKWYSQDNCQNLNMDYRIGNTIISTLNSLILITALWLCERMSCSQHIHLIYLGVKDRYARYSETVQQKSVYVYVYVCMCVLHIYVTHTYTHTYKYLYTEWQNTNVCFSSSTNLIRGNDNNHNG